MASVLLYIPVTGELEERIQRAIGPQVLNEETEAYRTIDNLSQRLVRLGDKPTIAVLLAPTRKELLDLYSIRHQFSDLRIILILPDQEEETITRGHRLYPRFLSYVDSDFKDVAAVLGKMMTLNHFIKNSKQKGGE